MKNIYFLCGVVFVLLYTSCSQIDDTGALEKEDTLIRCSDSVDNDDNGFIDCEDQDCLLLIICSESSESNESVNLSTPNNSSNNTNLSSEDVVRTHCGAFEIEDDQLCDIRDTSLYATVQIGETVWMAENLAFKTSSSWCYDNNDDLCDYYGRMYSWAEAMGIDTSYNHSYYGQKYVDVEGVCPEGWVLPTLRNFDDLVMYARGVTGDAYVGSLYTSTYDNGVDQFGLNVLMGGVRKSAERCDSCKEPEFYGISFATSIWGSGNIDTSGDIFGVSNLNTTIGVSPKSNGYYVRCIQASHYQLLWDNVKKVSQDSCNSINESKNMMCDRRTHTVYYTTTIGGRTWMSENLNYTIESEPLCYNNDPEYCITYGQLYRGDSVVSRETRGKSVCPEGWRLPNSNDVNELIETITADENTISIAEALKSKHLWERGKLEQLGGFDIYQFNATPGGFFDDTYEFMYHGNYGVWWILSNDGTLETIELSTINNELRKRQRSIETASSVRCILD
ncbi:MAG: hypothetical protein OCD01_14305 [Fibrobacterales bacterium]